jgi:hypothetical protein
MQNSLQRRKKTMGYNTTLLRYLKFEEQTEDIVIQHNVIDLVRCFTCDTFSCQTEIS